MQKSVCEIYQLYSKSFTVAGTILILLFIGIIQGSAADSTESKNISLNIHNGTIYTVVSEIEKQTDYMFLYKNEDIDNNIKVSIKAEKNCCKNSYKNLKKVSIPSPTSQY